MKPPSVIINGFPGELGAEILTATFRDIPLGTCVHICTEDTVPELGDTHLWHSPDTIVDSGYEVDWTDIPPLDETFIASMRDCETIYLQMAARFERKGRTLSHADRKRMYLSDLRYWKHIIESHDIVFFLSSNIPHSCFDYVIYCLCKKKGIPTIMGNHPTNSIRDILLLIDDFEESSIPLRDRLRELKHEKAVSGMVSLGSARNVALDEKYEAYVTEQTQGGEPVPWDIKTHAYTRGRLYYAKQWLSGALKKLGNPFNFVWRAVCFMARRCTPSYWERKRRERDAERTRRELFTFYDEHTVEPDLTKKYVYLALHFQPELTTCPLAGEFVNQELIVQMLAALLPQDVLLYVKEHPFQTERCRDLAFYETLAAIPNVRLIPRSFSSFKLAENCVATATATGRAGFEGLFREKPVLLFGHSFYQYAPGVYKVRSEDDCCKAIRAIVEEGEKPTLSEVRRFLRALQDVSIEGYVDTYFENITKLTREQNVRVVSSALAKKIKETLREEKKSPALT